MENPQLPLSASFEKEKFKRIVNATTDVEELRKLTLKLVDSYFAHKEAHKTLFRSILAPAPKIDQ